MLARRASWATMICAFCAATRLPAQVAPDLHWQTIATRHFRINFGPGLEQVARRAAGSIERAYGRLAKELHEPRGPIDLTIGDNIDVSNGYATVFPTNRIVIYARPTIDGSSLSFLDDWIDLVVTHELTHIFHLDRTEGWWRKAQYVFGRNPFLFPNLYTPSWLDEGIAVYYESRLTGSGRIVGTDHSMIVRAQALDGTMPALNALSASTLSYPLGQVAYAYGSLLMDFIARTAAPGTMRAFVDVSAGRTIPYLLNANAKRGFGVSFDSAWRVWTDSIRRNAFSLAATSTPIRDITTRGWTAQRVRWVDPDHLIYGNDDGRSLPALREVATAGGPPRVLAIRKTLDITSPLANGARVFAEADYVDPYTLRDDLYLEYDGHTRRLTSGARLTQPDARLDTEKITGAPATVDIVAVQVSPDADRLVRVRVVGSEVTMTPITGASPDTLWSWPRWSHDGTRIAATRWIHGGESEIAILDTAGHVITAVGQAHALNETPSWAADDRAIYFTSDRSGRSALYRANIADGALVRVAESATGLFENEPSPDGTQLATTHYKGDGFHVALVPAQGAFPAADSTSVLPQSRGDTSIIVNTKATAYSPLRSLLPRYWLPALGESDDRRPMFGLLTSGTDVLGRHQYEVEMTYEPRREEPNWNTSYQYAGLGNPVLGVTTEEDWEHATIAGNNGTQVGAGILARRRRIIDIALTGLRPRVMTNSYLSVGVETEWRDYRTDPSALLAQLDTSFAKVYAYPALLLVAGWGNARQPVLAISPEDGVQLTVSAKERWLADDPTSTRSSSVIGTMSAYKSLDFPGFAHHVIAFRAAAGWEDNKAADELDAGGVSGTTLSIAPGVIVGDPQRTFFARGFPAAVQEGTRALAATLEYRMPLVIPVAGLKMLPVFLQRVSAIAFADAASAWCPSGVANASLCSNGMIRDWMASAGAELHVDAALKYDVPYTFRFGIATPVVGREYFGGANVAVYFALGLAF